MYTKCPSCRVELNFLPPVNASSLPSGYMHRIRCPHCGVTIAVPIHEAVKQYNGITDDEPIETYVELEDDYIIDSSRYKADAKKAIERHNEILADYESAYEDYVNLLVNKVGNGSSPFNSIKIALKIIIMIFLVLSCVLTIVGIVALVLYILSSANSNIVLSLSMENFASRGWICFIVGVIIDMLLISLKSKVHVKGKKKSVSSKDMDGARKEYIQKRCAAQASVNSLRNIGVKEAKLPDFDEPKREAMDRVRARR